MLWNGRACLSSGLHIAIDFHRSCSICACGVSINAQRKTFGERRRTRIGCSTSREFVSLDICVISLSRSYKLITCHRGQCEPAEFRKKHMYAEIMSVRGDGVFANV